LGAVEAVCATHTAPVRFEADFPNWRGRREHGGGAVMDLAVHHFDLWRYLLDDEIEDLFATSRSRAGHDETIAVSTRMASGVLATSVCSYSTAVGNTVDVYGEAGRVAVSCYRFDGLQRHSAAAVPDGARSRARRIVRAAMTLPHAVASARRGGTWAASYREEWRHFATAIRRDTPPECTLEDGRRSLAAALAATKSIAQGEPVRVAEAPRSIAAAG
jgi:myo-inositol 2-dehydrogenase/D-chiro-inositol 1-dehydrogenase